MEPEPTDVCISIRIPTEKEPRMAATGTRALFLIPALLMSFALASGPGAGAAYACSCASRSLESEFRVSKAVFSGTVVGIDEDEFPVDVSSTPSERFGGPLLGKVTFEVEESLKGVSTKFVEVYGQGDGVSCGLNFQEGESYLVYAHKTGEKESGLLGADYCGSTRPLEAARVDISYLKSEGLITPETGGPVITPTLLAAGLGLAIAGSYLGWRTSRD